MGTINDLALLIPGRGNVLVGAAEAAVPSFASIVAYAANFSTAIPGFATLGHTDPEDLPEWGGDGGDTEVRRTWERLAVREVTTDPPARAVTVRSGADEQALVAALAEAGYRTERKGQAATA